MLAIFGFRSTVVVSNGDVGRPQPRAAVDDNLI
jgi:hypothetical protein